MANLLLNQFFHPSTAATAQYLADITTPQDTVICGPPDYSQPDETPPPPAAILRTRALPFSHAKLAKAASYATYLVGAAYKALRHPTPKAVLTLTTPPLLSLIGNLLHRHGTRHVIWEMDLYPDIAVDLGVFQPNSLTTKLIRKIANWSRHRADAIIALGPDMRDRLIAQGIPPEKIHICENWADPADIHPLPLPTGPLHILYSGNLGLAHDLATIRETILALADNPNYHFTFAGSGPQRRQLETDTRRLTNVTFQPYCSRTQLGQTLAQGHLGLVTQNPKTVGSVVPSKTYGIMAAARPILYIGPKSATPALIIQKHNCGWQIDPGDVNSLLVLLETLNQNRDRIKEAGARARQAFEQNYTKALGVARIRAVIDG